MNGCITTLVLSIALLTDTPASNPADTVAARTPRELIGISARISRSIKTDRDYAEMVYFLDHALRSDSLLPEHREYANKLKGWAHNRLGEAYANKGYEEKALKQFEQAVDLNPDHWKARHNRAVSYALDQRFEEALKDFSATSKLNPNYANAWYNRGEVQMRTGQVEEAIESYSKAIKINPQDAIYYISRSRAYQQLKQEQSAIDDLTSALQSDGQYGIALVERGTIYLQQGLFEKASKDFGNAVRLDGQHAEAYRAIAWMMATCSDVRYRDTERAVAFAEKGISLNGDEDYRFIDTLAAALANSEQYKKAVQVQQRAIELARVSVAETELEELEQRLAQYKEQTPHRQQLIAERPDQRGRVR